MQNLPKIIALYLPQFHQIPENDKFWGEGFTDWVAVRNAKPLYEGHNQPRIPLNNNYYDLSQKESIKWQANLANEYGIYGFGIYHYWFNNNQNLLSKPSEIIRDNDDIDINYCFVWDNTSWKRSWSNIPGNDWAPVAEQGSIHNGPQILVEYILGNESDWLNHYKYVSSHFHKEKYIKIDGKPVFCIFTSSPEILQMCKYWDLQAKNDGFPGISFIFRESKTNLPPEYKRYNYEPHTAALWKFSLANTIDYYLRRFFHKKEHITFFEFDKAWKGLLASAEDCHDNSLFYGAFVGYDDTPRRGTLRGKIVKGCSPEKFEKYFTLLIDICKRQDKEYIFLSAWNEWGEGMTLEPDTVHKYAYLRAVKNALTNN